ncbi:MAG: OB-fold nucleic acid binding domain-containing protein, partial [Akkermansiaceae bacterium]|nr:OB-fold nucleic acid binding domain-containing protein [Akkermansiaceae bacterium]
AMACKRGDERMERVTAKLRAGMTARGVERAAQEKIVAAIGSFALYGFPESHAISFALIAYASCWLKAHRPAEFYTGLINCQPMGFYSVNTLLQDARRHGIRVLPVCCAAGGDRTATLDDHTIRLGWHRIRGLSAATRARMTAEKARAPFESVADFLVRARPTTGERRALAQAGALNALPQAAHRRQALWEVERPLHADLLENAAEADEAAALAPMTLAERVEADYLTQGASVGPHPMKLWRAAAPVPDVLRASDLANLPGGLPLRIAGMAICRQRPGTAKGHCFISLEDETGIANLFVPRDTFQQFRLLVTSERYLLATGRLQRSEGDQPVVYVTALEILPGAAEVAAASRDFH